MNQTLEQRLDSIPESTRGERALTVAACLFIISYPLWQGLRVVIFGI